MTADTCPAESELLAFASAALPEPSVQAVARHLDGCQECLELIVALTHQRRDSMQSAGRYAIEAPIAQGGMGLILAATDATLQRSVVLKTARSLDAAAKLRFEREIRVTARLQHPSIVPVYDGGVLEDGTPFYAMRRVDGEELEACIRAASTPAQRLLLIRPYTDLVEAIAYAHAEGFIHRDLKPRNVLVGQFGETIVLDWGLAKAIDEPADSESLGGTGDLGLDPGLTETGVVMGTQGYVAPELRRGTQASPQSDVYSLGIILRRILTGEDGANIQPENGQPLRRAKAPADLEAIVRRATKASPQERYVDAGALAADLRRFEAGRLVEARAYHMGDRVLRWVRRHGAVVTTGVLSLGLLIGLATWTFLRVDAARSRAESALVLANRAEQRATEEREAAESLIDFALLDLSTELRDAGRMEALDRLATEVDAYYVQRGTTDAAQRILRHARAISIGARVAEERGALDVAQSRWKHTLGLLARTDGHPSPPEGTHWLRTEAESSRAMLLAKQGQLDEAVQAAQSAVASAEQYLASVGTTPSQRDRLRLPLAQSRLMVIQEHVGQMDEAAELARAILTNVPSSETFTATRELRVRAEGMLGRHALAQSDRRTAMAHILRAIDEAEKIRAQYPGAVISLDLVSTHRFELAQQFAAMNDLQAAEDQLVEVVEAQELLLALRPTAVDTVFKLSNTRTTLAAVLVERGQPQRAVALLYDDERALRTFDGDEANPETLEELRGFTEISLAHALAESGQLDKAEPFYSLGLDRLQRIAGPGSNPGIRARLAYGQLRAGGFYMQRGEFDLAVDTFAAAQSLRRRLAGDEVNAMEKIGIAEATAQLAKATWRAGDVALARTQVDHAIALVTEARETGLPPSAWAHIIDDCQTIADATGRPLSSEQAALSADQDH